MPHFAESIAVRRFHSRFRKYVSDQFVFRDFWIGAKPMRTGSWEKGEQRGLPRNKRVSDSGGYSPAEADLREKIEAIHSFDQATPEMNKYVMLVPTAPLYIKTSSRNMRSSAIKKHT